MYTFPGIKKLVKEVVNYYNLHLTQALRGLVWVKTERIAGR